MELEQRYIIFKLSDIRELDEDEAWVMNILDEVAETVAQVRQDASKPPLQAVVIEHDWPEYEPTLALLSARVDGTPAPAPVKVGQLTLEVGMQTDKVTALMQYIREALTTGDIKQGFAQGLMRRLEELAVTEVSPDANVERNRRMLLERSVVGLKKYGVTTEREDLNLGQWVQHAIEEVLDLANYLQALKTNIESEEHRIRKAFLEGFQMRGEADSASPNGCVWRSPEEAWVNSDAEEEFRVVMRKQAGS